METCRATHTWGTGWWTWWRVQWGSLLCCSTPLSAITATSLGKSRHGSDRERRVCCCRIQLVMCAERWHFCGMFLFLFPGWRAGQWIDSELTSILCTSTTQRIVLERPLTVSQKIGCRTLSCFCVWVAWSTFQEQMRLGDYRGMVMNQFLSWLDETAGLCLL